MKRDQIKVGGVYRARISGNFVDVRVTAIRQATTYRGRGTADVTVFDVLNLTTGRKLTFKSAAKFRHEVKPKAAEGKSAFEKAMPFVGGCVMTATQAESCKKPEGEQRADPLHGSGGDGTTASDFPTDDAPLDEFAADIAAEVDGNATPATGYDGGTVAGYTPTAEQAEVLRIARQPGLKVLVIEAGAGAGKTSQLRMLEEVLVGNGQYTAFNTSLVNDAKAKFKRCAVNTSHSLAFRAEGRRFAHRLNGPRVRGDVVARMLGIDKELVLDLGPNPKADPAKPETARLTKRLQPDFLASQAVQAVKRFCQSADREITVRHFKYIDGIDSPTGQGSRTYGNNDRVKEYLLPFARKAWADFNDPAGTLPGYTHDFYVKTWSLNKPYIAADYILLDEHQDSAPVLIDILKQQTHALLVLVGDGCQKIYSWRGAINAGDEFPDAPRAYLSQSFRFGDTIAAVANAILGTLNEPAKLRLRGTPSIASHVYHRSSAPLPPTCVLCRTNAAAVSTLLKGVDEGRKVHLIGGTADVVKFVEAAADLQCGRGTSHPELACFDSWNEVVAYVKEDDGADLQLMVKLIEEFGTDGILRALRNMPKENQADLVVCTSHKSKGREWSRVKLAADFPTADKMDDEARRLLYVAATRAKHVLDISECPAFKGPDAIRINVVNPAEPAPVVNEETKPAEVADDVAPTMPQQQQPVNGRGALKTFSWAKLRDGSWGIRGPVGVEAGARVEVERKNGTKSNETVVEAVGRFADGALYRVRSSR